MYDLDKDIDDVINPDLSKPRDNHTRRTIRKIMAICGANSEYDFAINYLGTTKQNLSAWIAKDIIPKRRATQLIKLSQYKLCKNEILGTGKWRNE
jgi:hypothetical protein